VGQPEVEQNAGWRLCEIRAPPEGASAFETLHEVPVRAQQAAQGIAFMLIAINDEYQGRQRAHCARRHRSRGDARAHCGES